MARATGWDDVPTQDSNQNYYDFYDAYNLSDEYEQIRLVGPVVTLEIGWIPALKKGGKGDTAFPMMSLRNDGKKCPLFEAGVHWQKITLSNAIIRSIQENKPEKKIRIPDKEFRAKGDKFWSPIRVVKFPNGPANKIKNLKSLNKVKTKDGIKTFPVNHPKYGIDILVSFDKSQSGSAMYEIQKDERTPLDKEEQAYLLYDLELVFEAIPTEEDIIQKLRDAYEKNLFDSKNCNLDSLRKLLAYDDEGEEDDDEDDFSMKRNKKKIKVNKQNKKNKGASKKDKRKLNKKKAEDYDDFDDEAEDYDDSEEDDFEEDEFEEEDEFDDVDNYEDDEDYEEVKSKRNKNKKDKENKRTRNSRSRSRDDDDEY